MKNILRETELNVLEILWNEGDTLAKDLAVKLNEAVNWKKTTSYTVLKTCIEKGLIERIGHNFTCRALITREEAQQRESKILADRMFNGSPDLLVASLLGVNKVTTDQLNAMRVLVQNFESANA